MNINKITGWFLLLLGLVVISASIYSSYDIFMGRKEAPEIFSYEKNDAGMEQVLKTNEPIEKVQPSLRAGSPEELQAEMQLEMKEAIGNEIAGQLKNRIPKNFISKTMNLFSWSIFAGILIFAGSQISSLGIKLLKEHKSDA